MSDSLIRMKQLNQTELTNLIKSIFYSLQGIPGIVALGTPTGTGIPFTMPSIPTINTTLTLQCSTDGITWTDIYTGLSGGATGIMNLGPDGGSPLGHQNELTYFRAKSSLNGNVGVATAAVTVGIPANPDNPGLTDWTNNGLGAYDLQVTVPNFPTNTIEFIIYLDARLTGEIAPTTIRTYSQEGISTWISHPSFVCDRWWNPGIKARNIYGESDLVWVAGQIIPC